MSQWIKTDFGPITVLDNHDPFPNTDQALIEPNGLIAISKTLEAKKLLRLISKEYFLGSMNTNLFYGGHPIQD